MAEAPVHGPLRWERWRRPFWRWWVVAVFRDGFTFPITRSGFWTYRGAAGFAVEAARWRDAGGFVDQWTYTVRGRREVLHGD